MDRQEHVFLIITFNYIDTPHPTPNRISFLTLLTYPLLRYSSSKNKFVHLALERTLTLASQLRGSKALQERLSYDLTVTIVGDNDFYSQRAQVCPNLATRVV